jgi:hypothetical protein
VGGGGRGVRPPSRGVRGAAGSRGGASLRGVPGAAGRSAWRRSFSSPRGGAGRSRCGRFAWRRVAPRGSGCGRPFRVAAVIQLAAGRGGAFAVRPFRVAARRSAWPPVAGRSRCGRFAWRRVAPRGSGWGRPFRVAGRLRLGRSGWRRVVPHGRPSRRQATLYVPRRCGCASAVPRAVVSPPTECAAASGSRFSALRTVQCALPGNGQPAGATLPHHHARCARPAALLNAAAATRAL